LTQPNPQPEKPTDTVLHLSAMGDMLAHDTIIANAKTDSGYDLTHTHFLPNN